MVVNAKQIGAAFVFLVLLLFVSNRYFDGEIKKKDTQLNEKRELIATLTQLESRWSRKAQDEALARVFKLLDVFDVTYDLKKRREIKIITMQLTKKNADRVLALFVHSTIRIKKIKIEKKDNFRVVLQVEVL